MSTHFYQITLNPLPGETIFTIAEIAIKMVEEYKTNICIIWSDHKIMVYPTDKYVSDIIYRFYQEMSRIRYYGSGHGTTVP